MPRDRNSGPHVPHSTKKYGEAGAIEYRLLDSSKTVLVSKSRSAASGGFSFYCQPQYGEAGLCHGRKSGGWTVLFNTHKGVGDKDCDQIVAWTNSLLAVC